MARHGHDTCRQAVAKVSLWFRYGLWRFCVITALAGDAGSLHAQNKAKKIARACFMEWQCSAMRFDYTRKAVAPNGQHQRWEPAATERQVQTELNGWLPSAGCCGVRLTWA